MTPEFESLQVLPSGKGGTIVFINNIKSTEQLKGVLSSLSANKSTILCFADSYCLEQKINYKIVEKKNPKPVAEMLPKINNNSITFYPRIKGLPEDSLQDKRRF